MDIVKKQLMRCLKEILLKNYIQLLDEIEKEADYCTVDSYWKDFIPHETNNKSIIDAKDFIEKGIKPKEDE
jgi:hypothetical protein